MTGLLGATASSAVSAPPTPAPVLAVVVADAGDPTTYPDGTSAALDDVDHVLARWRAETGWVFSRGRTVLTAQSPASCAQDDVRRWAAAQLDGTDLADTDVSVLALTPCDDPSWTLERRWDDPATIGLSLGRDPVRPTLHPLVGRVARVPTVHARILDDDGRLVQISPNPYGGTGTGAASPGSEPGALDSIVRSALGVLQPGEVADFDGEDDLDETRTFQLASRGAASGLRGLAVRDASTGYRLWFDYRDRTGLDADAPYGGERRSHRVRWTTGVTVTSAEQGLFNLVPRAAPAVDGSPSWDGAFGPGTTLRTGRLTVVFGEQAERATVTVTREGRYDAAFEGGAPRVVGTVRVGGTARVAYDAISPEPTTHGVQWYLDGEPVRGATGPTFRLGRDDLHARLSVRLRADRDRYVPIDRTSAGVRVAAGVFSAPRPVVRGSLRVGTRASVSIGTWTPRSTYTAVQWYADGRALRRADDRTLLVTKALRGKRLSVRVRGTRVAYQDLTLTSVARRVPR